MQIHEITKLTEAGILQGIKNVASKVGSAVAQGAATYGRNVAQQFGYGGSVAGSTQLQKSIANLWAQKVEQLEKFNQGQPIDEPTYQAELEEFIDNAFFKGQMNLLPPAGKQGVQHAIHKITTQRNNPTAMTSGFAELVNAASTTVADPRTALQSWIGKQLKVNLNDGGVVRPAVYSWDGNNWIDAITGQAAPLKIKQKLTRVALGQV